MGDYINPGTGNFEISLNSEIYVDKSNLIAKTNAYFWTEKRFICISRPRRFGKTMAANMLAAYYGLGEDASGFFGNLAIAKHSSYQKHLNKHDVIMIDMQDFLSQAKLSQEESNKATPVKQMLEILQETITDELIVAHPEIEYKNKNNFIQVMKDTYRATKRPFVILIDEWDCIFRGYPNDIDSQKDYLDFLRLWLKGKSYVGLAYMTGILPIKKYGTHSALNMFGEYSMTDPGRFLDYFGFRDFEVEYLATEYGADFEEIKKWYNGYFVEMGTPILNPTSVSRSLENNRLSNYWNKTETYESLKDYIKLDFDCLQNKITQLIAGEEINVNSNKFTNDMRTFNSSDDVLTLLVHLGYLTYDFATEKAKIPNEEVKREFINSIEDLEGWNGIITAIRNSESLLQAIWNMDSESVAIGVQKIHEQNTSIFEYNDENSLSCILNLALYSASNYYSTFRELSTGKGFADLVFIPRKKFVDKPAMVVELKWDETTSGAISQIKERNYISALEEYQGNLLLVGINYDKKSKSHECTIERLEYGTRN